MPPITRSAAVLLSLLALLPLAWHPVELATADCPMTAIAPATANCCCVSVVDAQAGCPCTIESDDAGGDSPATPAPASVRTALSGQAAIVVAVLGEDRYASDPHAAATRTRPHGELPPRLAHCLFTL